MNLDNIPSDMLQRAFSNWAEVAGVKDEKEQIKEFIAWNNCLTYLERQRIIDQQTQTKG